MSGAPGSPTRAVGVWLVTFEPPELIRRGALEGPNFNVPCSGSPRAEAGSNKDRVAKMKQRADRNT